MRYALVDLDGAVRDRFSTRGAVREALREIDAEDPGTAAEFFVVTYGADGVQQGDPERGDEMIAGGIVFIARLDWRDEPEDDATKPLVVAGASR